MSVTTQHIGLFVNSSAGNGRAEKTAVLIQQRLQAVGILFTRYDNWPTHLQDISEAWIVGGDGTINYFINQYKTICIPIAVFKGGTGNDFAWMLYGDMHLEAQIIAVLAAIPRATDVGSCNGQLYLNSAGIGFDGEVLRSMNSIRFIGGHLGYFWVVLKKICSFKEFTFTITYDNEKLSGPYLIVAINNARRTGGGFKISPTAIVTDGLLDIVLCNKIPVWKRLGVLPVVEKGKHLQKSYITHRLQKEVLVQCPYPVYAQLDGELIQSDSFAIKVLPGYLLFKY